MESTCELSFTPLRQV